MRIDFGQAEWIASQPASSSERAKTLEHFPSSSPNARTDKQGDTIDTILSSTPSALEKVANSSKRLKFNEALPRVKLSADRRSNELGAHQVVRRPGNAVDLSRGELTLGRRRLSSRS